MEQSNSFPNQPLDQPLPQSGQAYSLPSPILPTENLKNSKIKKFLIIFALIVLLGGIILLIISFFQGKGLKKTSITLTYWGLFEPASVFEQVINDYEKSHPGVKINYSQEDLKYYSPRLQAALARGEGPDIFRLHQTWVPMLGKYLSVLPSSVYDSASFEKDFYPSAVTSLKFKNSYVAIPLEYDGLALFYNEDLFRAIGAVPPKTWKELKSLACKLTVKDQQGKIRTAGVALGTTANIDQWSDILGLMMLQNGADLNNPAGCSKEGACLGRDALIFYTLFASDHACEGEEVNPGAVWNASLPGSTYLFAGGSLAMYFGPSWKVFDLKAINPNLNFKVVPVPQLEGINVAWSSFWAEGVSNKSKYQKEAWDFLKYLSSDAVLQKLYNTQSALRLFGEPYPKTNLANLLKDQSYVFPFLQQASFAKSWYLSSNTNDEGINTRIIKYYEDAVNAASGGSDPVSALSTVSSGVTQVLGQYESAK